MLYININWTTVTTPFRHLGQAISANWKIKPEFSVVRKKCTKAFFDELRNGECFQVPEAAFEIRVFCAAVDAAIEPLQSRFKGQTYSACKVNFSLPTIVAIVRLYDTDLELAATELQQPYFRQSSEKQKTGLDLKLIMSSHLTSPVPELAIGWVLFATLPVTIAGVDLSQINYLA